MYARGLAKSRAQNSRQARKGGRGRGVSTDSVADIEEPQEQHRRNSPEDNSGNDRDPSAEDTSIHNHSNSADIGDQQEQQVHIMSDGREGGISSTSSIPVSEMPIDPKVIQIEDGCFLGNAALQEITNIFKSFFPGPFPTWKKVLETKTVNLWEKFKEKFSWPPEKEDLVYRVWYATAGKRYKEILSRARRDAMDKAGTTKITETKHKFPEFIGRGNWCSLIDGYWGKEEYAEKCQKASQNRLASKHGTVSTHTGGSVNFPTHRKKMEEERKRPVGRHEVYLRTHKKQKGTGPFVDKKSELVEDKYRELLVGKYGPEIAEDDAFWDEDLWKEAAGGVEKGRLYGQGPSNIFLARARASAASASSAASTSSHESQQLLEDRIRTSVREEMREEMEKQVEERLAAMKKECDEEMKKRDEEQKKRDEEMKKLEKNIDALMKAVNPRIE